MQHSDTAPSEFQSNGPAISSPPPPLQYHRFSKTVQTQAPNTPGGGTAARGTPPVRMDPQGRPTRYTWPRRATRAGLETSFAPLPATLEIADQRRQQTREAGA